VYAVKQHESPFEHRRFRRVADVHRDKQPEQRALTETTAASWPSNIEPLPDNAAPRACDGAASKGLDESRSGKLRALWMSYWQTGLGPPLSSPSAPKSAWPNDRAPHSLAVADWPRPDTQEWLPRQVPSGDGAQTASLPPTRFTRLLQPGQYALDEGQQLVYRVEMRGATRHDMLRPSAERVVCPQRFAGELHDKGVLSPGAGAPSVRPIQLMPSCDMRGPTLLTFPRR